MPPQSRGAVAPPACRDTWKCSRMAVESHPPPLHGTQKTRRPQCRQRRLLGAVVSAPGLGCPPVLADAEGGLPQLNRVSGRFNPCQTDCILLQCHSAQQPRYKQETALRAGVARREQATELRGSRGRPLGEARQPGGGIQGRQTAKLAPVFHLPPSWPPAATLQGLPAQDGGSLLFLDPDWSGDLLWPADCGRRDSLGLQKPGALFTLPPGVLDAT